MATPYLDQLNVALAYRLGDPATPQGVIVDAVSDGRVYPAVFRDRCITEALRDLINLAGPAKLAMKGIRDPYIRRVNLTTNPEQLPTDCARVIHVEFFKRKVEHVPFSDGRRNSVYWQNALMYDIEWNATGMFIRLSGNVDTAPSGWQDNVVMHYLLELYDLRTQDIDVLIGTYWHKYILARAEAIARRNHQELAMALEQRADAELKATMEN